jgi:hypothetical protein
VSPLNPKFAFSTRHAVGIALGALLLTACNSLDVENPNAPDANRALADPAAIEAVAGGTLRSWFNTWDGMEGGGPLVTMSQTYSASWNNFNMNFYSSIDADGTRNTRAYQNDLASAGRTTMIAYWEGYYSTLSSAVDVLTAIRKNNLVISNAGNTRRAETIAQFMHGAALMGIALNYDKGYVIDETSDLATLAYKSRKEVRDAAVASLERAATLAAANLDQRDSVHERADRPAGPHHGGHDAGLLSANAGRERPGGLGQGVAAGVAGDLVDRERLRLHLHRRRLQLVVSRNPLLVQCLRRRAREHPCGGAARSGHAAASVPQRRQPTAQFARSAPG